MRLLKRRKEVRFTTYEKADKLCRKGWVIAKEEDKNHTIGWVWIELLEDSRFLKFLKKIFNVNS